MGTHPIFESDFDCLTDMSDFKTRRAAAREKHGEGLREKFKKIDKDNSGYASIDEMCVFLSESGAIKLGKNTIKEFQASMKHYLDNFNYDKTKENELNEKEFVSFWSDLYAVFDKLTKMEMVISPLLNALRCLMKKQKNMV